MVVRWWQLSDKCVRYFPVCVPNMTHLYHTAQTQGQIYKNIEKYMPSFYFDVENISFSNIVHKYVSWVGVGVQCICNRVIFSPKYHRHPIAHPGGRGMGYLLWVQCLTYVSPWSVYCCKVRSIWYHGIFVRVIMAPDWISGLMSSITGMSRLLLIVINIIADKTFNITVSERKFVTKIRVRYHDPRWRRQQPVMMFTPRLYPGSDG